MVLILIATTVHTGEKAIRDHTDRFLVQTIPSILSRIPEDEAAFAAFYPRYRSGRRTRFAGVEVSHRAGDCFADYRIAFEEAGRRLAVLVRVELNVRRLNFNLYLPVEALDRVLGAGKARTAGSPTADLLRRKVFMHTLDAASTAGNGNGETVGAGAYTFHDRIFSRTLESRKWYVLVGSCALARDLLWNPAERLFVAQDLMFMLRAMASEGMELFVE